MCAIEIKLPNNERRYITEFNKVTILGADGDVAGEAVATKQGFNFYTKGNLTPREVRRGENVLLDNGTIFEAIHTTDALNLDSAQDARYWKPKQEHTQ